MYRHLSCALLVLVWAVPASRAAESKPETIPVWPGKVPGEKGEVGPEKLLPPRGKKPVKRLTNVSKPTLTIYKPSKEKNTGAAVVIAPGGGYHILAWDLEGEEVATWLNSIGVTGIILKYRVPRRPDQPRGKPPLGPLQDAQRAISLVRSKARQWDIDPQRIGMLGFSAGGNLTARTATNFDRRSYEARDAVDRVSCRPDFAILIYPAYLYDSKKKELAPDIRISDKTPPCFFAHASDDRVSVENSVHMYLALRRHKVNAELHAYSSGGHGFGLRPSKHPCSTWPGRCEAWMRSLGMLAKEKNADR